MKSNEKPWVVRPATVQDAKAISEIFMACYPGDNYPFREFLRKDSITKNLADSNTNTLVVENNTGVFATGSIVKKYKGQVIEFGRAGIHPEYRSLRFPENGKITSPFRDLIQERINLAYQNGAQVLYTCSVTSHPRTMAAFLKKGFVPIAFETGKYPNIFERYDIEGKSFRESTVVMVHKESPVYKNDINKGVVVGLEEGLVKTNLNLLGLKRELINESYNSNRVTIYSEVDSNISMHAKYTIIPGNQTSLDEALDFVKNSARDLKYVQVEVDSQLKIDVHDKLEGFVVSGFMPNFVPTENGQKDMYMLEYVADNLRDNFRDRMSLPDGQYGEPFRRLLDLTKLSKCS